MPYYDRLDAARHNAKSYDQIAKTFNRLSMSSEEFSISISEFMSKLNDEYFASCDGFYDTAALGFEPMSFEDAMKFKEDNA